MDCRPFHYEFLLEKIMANKYSESDYWTRKAFNEGYPARSVYKLQEINSKFSILSPSMRILDLGAAPGSWTAFLLRNLSNNARIVSIDLKPLDAKIKDDRLTFIQGDMTSKESISQIEKMSPFDVVVCDVAPYTSGHKDVDVARQNGLAEIAVFYANKFLVERGSFITKIFQGKEVKSITEQLKSTFSTVRTFKPEACRKNSIETYIIAMKFSKKS